MAATPTLQAEFFPFTGFEGPGLRATDLHAALRVGTKFRDWIRNRRDSLGLVEGIDIVTISGRAGARAEPAGRRRDAALTFGAALRIAGTIRDGNARDVANVIRAISATPHVFSPVPPLPAGGAEPQLMPTVLTQTSNGVTLQLVDMRDLHTCLRIDTPYEDWVSRRVAEHAETMPEAIFARVRKSPLFRCLRPQKPCCKNRTHDFRGRGKFLGRLEKFLALARRSRHGENFGPLAMLATLDPRAKRKEDKARDTARYDPAARRIRRERRASALARVASLRANRAETDGPSSRETTAR